MRPRAWSAAPLRRRRGGCRQPVNDRSLDIFRDDVFRSLAQSPLWRILRRGHRRPWSGVLAGPPLRAPWCHLSVQGSTWRAPSPGPDSFDLWAACTSGPPSPMRFPAPGGPRLVTSVPSAVEATRPASSPPAAVNTHPSQCSDRCANSPHLCTLGAHVPLAVATARSATSRDRREGAACGLISSMGTVGDCFNKRPDGVVLGLDANGAAPSRSRTTSSTSTTRPGATAPSATSLPTNSRTDTRPKPRPRCLKACSTEWDTGLMVGAGGLEPSTSAV